MSIEKAGSVGPSISLNPVVVPKVDRDLSSQLTEHDVDQDGFLTLDEMKVPNNVKEQAFKGADLDGDGVVSQRELVIQNSRSQSTDADLEDARKTLSEVSALLAKQNSNHPAGTADSVAQAIFSLNFSETKVDKLLKKIESDVDLSIMA